MNQSQVKQKRLMEKAQELFWKYGYNGVSIDQIANEAGISKMTVYKHFNSKDALFIQVLIEYSDLHFDIIIEKLKEIDHTLEKMEFFYSYSMELSKAFPAILVKDVMEKPYVMEKLTAYKRQRSLLVWNYILQDGIQKGEIRQLDVDFVSNILLGLPMIFINSDYLKEDYRNKLIYNFFDFIKYGLLGGIESPQGHNKGEENDEGKECSAEDRKS